MECFVWLNYSDCHSLVPPQTKCRPIHSFSHFTYFIKIKDEWWIIFRNCDSAWKRIMRVWTEPLSNLRNSGLLKFKSGLARRIWSAFVRCQPFSEILTVHRPNPSWRRTDEVRPLSATVRFQKISAVCRPSASGVRLRPRTAVLVRRPLTQISWKLPRT